MVIVIYESTAMYDLIDRGYVIKRLLRPNRVIMVKHTEGGVR